MGPEHLLAQRAGVLDRDRPDNQLLQPPVTAQLGQEQLGVHRADQVA